MYSFAMELVRYFYKNLGETPLSCLRRFQAANPAYDGLSATYAGRLDPAAEGEILFLFGDMVHEKDTYLAHDKIYTATFALGVSTDTGDLLGMPLRFAQKNETSNEKSVAIPDEEKIKELLSEMMNVKTQTYPAYSSKTVHGKPLFAYAREGEVVERPSRDVEIFACDFVETRMVPLHTLLERVEKICTLVSGDFRQEEILAAWQGNFQKLPGDVPLVTLSLHVSSGTYIRSLTENVEKILGTPSVLYSLVRDKIIEK
jgi:tRNA pseudouridine(55) synthase